MSNGPQRQGIALEYTLADAAKAARVNKSTMFRAIKSGRLSARRLEDGSYRVDASELSRVYDLQHLTRGGADALQQSAPGAETPATVATPGASETELAELRVKVAMLERLLDERKETIEDLRRTVDEERQERRALQRQLAAPPAEKPQEAPIAPATATQSSVAPRSFLARLLGHG